MHNLWLGLHHLFKLWAQPIVCLISGQVDLWTRKSVGCACSWKDNEHDHAKDKHETSDKNLTIHNGHHKHNSHQLNCACCVKGGCQCGEQAPNRCSQCGLENHCLNSEFKAFLASFPFTYQLCCHFQCVM